MNSFKPAFTWWLLYLQWQYPCKEAHSDPACSAPLRCIETTISWGCVATQTWELTPAFKNSWRKYLDIK